jgi:hypothetical protein
VPTSLVEIFHMIAIQSSRIQTCVLIMRRNGLGKMLLVEWAQAVSVGVRLPGRAQVTHLVNLLVGSCVDGIPLSGNFCISSWLHDPEVRETRVAVLIGFTY